MSELEQSVVATLAWFELSRQPLTAFECWHYLWKEEGEFAATPNDVEQALRSLAGQGAAEAEGGFWRIKGSDLSVAERQRRARFAVAKRLSAQRGARFIAKLPFIRFVGLVNTVAYEAAAPDSDIDLFIVVADGHLWFTRALTTALVHLMGWRRHGDKVQDRLCLSFLVTERAAGLEPLRLRDDPYLTYWVAGVLPLQGAQAYQGFVEANAWAADRLPNRFKLMSACVAGTDGDVWAKRSAEEVFGGRLGALLERMSKMLQVRRHRHHTASRLWQGGTAVVVTDDVMKFHETDQREILANSFRKRLSELMVL